MHPSGGKEDVFEEWNGFPHEGRDAEHQHYATSGYQKKEPVDSMRLASIVKLRGSCSSEQTYDQYEQAEYGGMQHHGIVVDGPEVTLGEPGCHVWQNEHVGVDYGIAVQSESLKIHQFFLNNDWQNICR
jgi:hypothetical protein